VIGRLYHDSSFLHIFLLQVNTKLNVMPVLTASVMIENSQSSQDVSENIFSQKFHS
jgi:hypothetical protein